MSKLKYAFTIVLLVACAGLTLAQTSKGTIVGTVLDPNGASVSGANIKLTNTQTGSSREVTTTSEGAYRLEAVDPGSYKIEVTAPGFKATTIQNVISSGGQTSDYPVSLAVGNPSEVVEVTSESVVLQTQDGTRVDTLDTRQITELPVAGLNPVNLVFTLPGVVDPGGKAGGFVQGTEFSVNGLRPRANNQLIDGLDNNDNNIAGQFYQPTLRDGFNEVTVLQGDFSAEYGRAGGAVVNVLSRGGTNGYHGSFYDVINSSALSSLTSGQKATENLKKVPVSIENTFGFSFGGPIVKNKFFFFATMQPDLSRSNTTATARVPTAAGFATLRTLFPAGANTNVDYYLNIVGNIRGVTNASNVSLGGGRPSVEFATASIPSSQRINDYQGLFRVDYSRKDTDTYSVRYLYDKQTFPNQSATITIFPGFEQDTTGFIQNFYFNNTRTLSARTTNEFRMGYGRFNVVFGQRNPATVTGGPSVGFSSSVGNITGVGLNALFPQGRIFNNIQVQDTLAHTIGNHSLRLGFDINSNRSKDIFPVDLRGTLTFYDGGGFNAFGNFVDARSGNGGGFVPFATRTYGTQIAYPRAIQQNYFINDNWRVKENLTLNLGLRYENYGTPFNAVPFAAITDINQPFATQQKIKRDNNNFAPRLSFAYTPRFSQSLIHKLTGENRTVIRGGFAVNYDFFFNNIVDNTASSSPNDLGFTAITPPSGRGATGVTPAFFPASVAPDPFTAMTTTVANLVNPLTYVWNLGVQRELPGKFILDTAYVGTRGTHLFLNLELNPGRGPGLSRVNRNRGSIIARTNSGDSIYHSLQARLERGFKQGLFMRVAYTYSKAIDDVQSEVFVQTGGSTRPSDPLSLLGGLRADRSVAAYDVPHRFVVTALYHIPSPLQSHWAKSVLGGFTLSGVFRIQSGNVETPYIGGIDMNGDRSAFNDRPAISNPNAPFNSVAFNGPDFCGIPGYGDFNCNPINLSDARYVVDFNIRNGLAGRNTLRAPAFNRLDLSLEKSINVPKLEGHKLSLRVEFFNVLNHPAFAYGTGADDISDGNVLNQSETQNFFANPRLNNGGNAAANANRYGRIQIRYSF
jgi:Carboxypeptidase regulatory-like domain/TonB-dependent Receptor Plug Domain/TonB dependent receptor